MRIEKLYQNVMKDKDNVKNNQNVKSATFPIQNNNKKKKISFY